MASLRARILLSVLLLAAAGLVALAAVTYVDQRSFLEGRVNQELRDAAPAVSRALDREGLYPPGVLGSAADQGSDAGSAAGKALQGGPRAPQI